MLADCPSVLLLRLYPREVLTDVHEEMATKMFLAVLFITMKSWKRSKFHNNGADRSNVEAGLVFSLVSTSAPGCARLPRAAVVYDEHLCVLLDARTMPVVQ